MTELITGKLSSFLQQRADKFEVLRRKPVNETFDFSFVISQEHLHKFKKEEIINFILEFIAGIEQETNSMKQKVNQSMAMAARFYQNALVGNKIEFQ